MGPGSHRNYISCYYHFHRLKEFISKKSEREREIQERKRQKFEKLKETPKHIFQDESYYQQREVREKNLYDSLDKGECVIIQIEVCKVNSSLMLFPQSGNWSFVL